MSIRDADSDQVPENVYAALRELLILADGERAAVSAQCMELADCALRAAEADALGNKTERDTRCKALLNQAYELFGECEPVEHLVALLGYDSDTDPGEN